jgi:transposase, IS30 family
VGSNPTASASQGHNPAPALRNCATADHASCCALTSASRSWTCSDSADIRSNSERYSRFVLLTQMNGCTATHALDGFSRRFNKVIPELRQSFTYDRGSEMARHLELTAATGMPVYFCEPYSPWQRGSNENMNGLVRQFLPKGVDLSTVTPQKLAYIEAMLNDRPRKRPRLQNPSRGLYRNRAGQTRRAARARGQNRCTSDLTPPSGHSRWLRIPRRRFLLRLYRHGLPELKHPPADSPKSTPALRAHRCGT